MTGDQEGELGTDLFFLMAGLPVCLIVFLWSKIQEKSLVGVAQWIESACEPKSHWFDFQSGHMPGLQARSPVGGL